MYLFNFYILLIWKYNCKFRFSRSKVFYLQKWLLLFSVEKNLHYNLMFSVVTIITYF